MTPQIVQRSGDYTPQSFWSSDSVLLAGDAIGLPNAVQGLKLGVPRTLPYRRLYVAAVVLPSVTTGYIVSATSTATFNLRMDNEGKDYMSFSFDNPNTTGRAFPGAGASVKPVASIRPQFRVANRLQQQQFAVGQPEPMNPDGMEAVFRTTASGPMPDAVEWLVQMAPFRFMGPINEVSLNVENSTSISPDQILLFLGCLSSSEYQ